MKYLLLLAPLALIGCTKPDNSIRTLQSMGYSSIEITGYKFFACSEDDFYSTGFEAVSPNGNLVEGSVCRGFWFKGDTIRVQRVS